MLTLSLEGIISLYLYHLSVHKLNFKYLIPILTTTTIQPYTDVDYNLYRSRTFLACTQPFHSIPLRHWISRFSYSPPPPPFENERNWNSQIWGPPALSCPPRHIPGNLLLPSCQSDWREPRHVENGQILAIVYAVFFFVWQGNCHVIKCMALWL